MGEGYDALAHKLENLSDTVSRVHQEVEIQNNMVDQSAADVEATKNVMIRLTDKTKEYLQTTDNCQTGIATSLCCSFLIMAAVVFFLYN